MAPIRFPSLIAFLTLLIVACTAPRPPHGVVTDQGSAWAEDPESATRLVQDLERLAPPVRQLLGETRDVVPEVWLQRELAAYRWWAAPHYLVGLVPASQERIHLRALPSAEPPGDRVLAHELTHLLVPASVGDRLPWAVEEAVCDIVSHNVAPGPDAAADRWWLLFSAWSALRGRPPELIIEVDLPGRATPTRLGQVDIDSFPRAMTCRSVAAAFTAETPPTPEFCNRVERGLAFFVLQRVVGNLGVEETLRQVRSRAQGERATDWRLFLTARAGLPPAPATWSDAVLDDLRAGDAAAAFSVGLRWNPPPGDEPHVPLRVVHRLARAFPGTDPLAVFAQGNLRLTLHGTDHGTDGTSISLSISDIPWVTRDLIQAWPDPPDPSRPAADP